MAIVAWVCPGLTAFTDETISIEIGIKSVNGADTCRIILWTSEESIFLVLPGYSYHSRGEWSIVDGQ